MPRRNTRSKSPGKELSTATLLNLPVPNSLRNCTQSIFFQYVYLLLDSKLRVPSFSVLCTLDLPQGIFTKAHFSSLRVFPPHGKCVHLRSNLRLSKTQKHSLQEVRLKFPQNYASLCQDKCAYPSRHLLPHNKPLL